MTQSAKSPPCGRGSGFGHNRAHRVIVLTQLVVLVTTLLSGCWDAVPIESRAIATGLAVDVGDAGDPVMVLTSLLLSPSKEAQERSFTVSGVGTNVGASRQDRQSQVSTRLLFGQLQVVLFSEDIAKTGFDDILDYFIRYARISHTINAAVCQGTASDYLKLQTTEHLDIGSHIQELISKATDTVPLPAVTLHEFIYDVVTPHHRAVLPYVVIEGGKPALRGLALFRGSSLVATILGEDASVLTELRYSDVFGSHPFRYQYQGKTFLATMDGATSRRVSADYQDERWSFTINLSFVGHLVDKSRKDGLKDPEEAQKLLESALAEHLEEQANRLVKRLQTELKVDALDLARYALAKGRKRLEGVNWDEQFIEADIKVKVKVTMETVGEGM